MKTGDLVATSCGTAVAAVCVLGLFHLQRTLGGAWAAAAVVLAGLVCATLARAFGRLATIVPSGAGHLAYVSRAFGRRAGIATAVPYLLLTLALVGAEAVVVGLVVARLTPLPVPAGALLFLVGTWAVCRAGLRVSYRAQALATWTLLLGLGALALGPIAGAAWRGELGARLLPPAPEPSAFVAGVGQALFLFMGFELIACQVEIASPRAVRCALGVSVAILTAFYGLLSLAFACLASGPDPHAAGFVPQLALAEEAGGPAALVLVALLSVLASFTSFNGALLSLSRFAYALAAQGALPRRLARVDATTLVPRAALDVLLGLAAGATVLVIAGDGLAASILAAAVAAALMYAAAMLARERAPFAEPARGWAARLGGAALALALAGLGIGVLMGAGAARGGVAALLVMAYGAAALAAHRAARPARTAAPRLTAAVGAHGD